MDKIRIYADLRGRNLAKYKKNKEINLCLSFAMGGRW